jgi:hypothetical protein
VTRPFVELIAAILIMLAGAWLIGWWAVGIVLVFVGLGVAVDAVLRDDANRVTKGQLSNEVLERWRRAR